MAVTTDILGMTKYTDDPERSWIRALFVGPSGGGKTHLSGTFPAPYFINADKGMATLRAKKIPYITIESSTRASNIVMDIMKAAKKKEPPFDKIETLVVDSLTSLSDLMELELVRFPVAQTSEVGKEVMSLPDFRIHRRRILNLVRFAQDIPMNVIFTANLKSDKDELTGQMLQVPSVAGSQLPTEMTALFDEVYYLEYDDKNKEYVAYTKSFRWFKQGKTRFPLPDRMVDPSWDSLKKFYVPEEK